jgi:Contractile injection system tube protein/LysM domain
MATGAVNKAHLSAEGGGSVKFDFNPENVTKSQSVPSGGGGGGGGGKAAAPPVSHNAQTGTSHASSLAKGAGGGGGKPVAGYVAKSTAPAPSTYSLKDVLFDDPMGTSVATNVAQLFSWLEPLDKTNAQPTLQFGWGSMFSFPCVITKVDATYTLFDPTGNPIRAKVNVTLQERPAKPGAQNPTSGSIGGLGARVLVSGDTLQSIAHQEYGKPSLWRRLADLNGIDDPMRVPPGTVLHLPRRSDLEPAVPS